ncbi:DUF4003 family protein [uncultured Clostridium sp.]|uniref:DUF4003 family protein n=1 Tax=uncultured Clostridium sp. TaxID=59620 RepID=UPI00262AD9EC|nr:DUF4003 family protein [uncultured Clostridium sp.]
MNIGLLDICNSVMDSYKLVKDGLRFDGEYINHFASLVFGGHLEEIDLEKIKKIRKYIKNETSQLSSFRGDMLYLISILISREENYSFFSDRLIKVSEEMQDVGFKESKGLTLAAYAICKHGNLDLDYKIYNNTKLIYDLLKKEFKEITDENDYLVCALLGIKCAKENEDAKETGEFVEYMFNYLLSLENYSKNHLQMLATSLLLNTNIESQFEVKELIESFKEQGLTVGNEVLGIIGAANRTDSIERYIFKVREVIEYICDEEGAYLYYMDKNFRVLIGITIVEYFNKQQDSEYNKYLEELLAFSIYSFSIKNNNGSSFRKEEEEKVYS